MIERLIWVVPLGVAALGVWRPRAGLVALAAALPLFGSPPGGPYLAALDVAGLAAILTAWRGGRPRPSALTWPAAAFVAVSFLSLVPSPYLPPSWRPSILFGLLRALPGVESWPALYTWRAATDLLLGWGLFLAVRRAFSGRSPKPLALGLLAGLAATVVLGLAAHAGLLSLDAYRPDQDLHSAVKRLTSVFFLTSWLSEYLVVGAPLAIAGLFLAGRRCRLLAPLLLALLLVSLVLTHARGAWAAAVAQGCFWVAVSLWNGRRDRTRLRNLAVAGGVTVALSAGILVGIDTPVEPLLERAGAVPSGLTPRVVLWETAADMVRSRPMSGWGLGSFAPAYDLLHPPGTEGAAPLRGTAHSLYFQVAAERGILGVIALSLFAWTAAACLRRPRRGRETLALALAVSLLGTAVYGLVQHMYYLRNIAWVIWLLTACVTLVSRCDEPILASRVSRVLALAALLLVPVRGLLVDSPSYAGDRAYGLHEMERPSSGPFRWTEQFAARRIPWAGETLVLSLANGHPRVGERPVTVVVDIEGQTVASLKISAGWEEHRFELGPAKKEWILVTFDTRPTFRPFSDYRRHSSLQPSQDIRSLGVAIKEVRWE